MARKQDKLTLQRWQADWLRKQCKRHKMRPGEYMVYLMKVNARVGDLVDVNDPANAMYRFTTKEARAFRRTPKLLSQQLRNSLARIGPQDRT